MIDIHCHILWGFDAGAQNAEDALAMARIAFQDGVTDIIATPHLFRSFSWRHGFEQIMIKCQELASLLEREKIPLRIHPGAEVHFVHNLLEELRKHRHLLVLNGSSYLLLEFPTDHVFPRIKHFFFEMLSEGVIPIIAHPERNTVFARHPGLLYELILMGAFAQVNAGSLRGKYGSRVRLAVLDFIDNRLVHFVGSDGHNIKSREPLLSHAREIVSERAGEKAAFGLFEVNPRAVLENRALPYQPEPINPNRKSRKLRIRIPIRNRPFFKRNSNSNS